MKFNVILGLFLLITCIFISIKISNKYTFRKKFYKEVTYFNDLIKEESIKEYLDIAKGCGDKSYKCFNGLISNTHFGGAF